MKKIFTVFFLLFAVVAFAQPKIGLKAGLNIANAGGDDADQIIEGRSLDSKTGLRVHTDMDIIKSKDHLRQNLNYIQIYKHEYRIWILILLISKIYISHF